LSAPSHFPRARRFLRRRLQTKEAKEGGKFAEEEYEKYRQAAKEAKENYLTGLKKHDEEREDLDSEKVSAAPNARCRTLTRAYLRRESTQPEDSSLRDAGSTLSLSLFCT
jgi:hypothetical protein